MLYFKALLEGLSALPGADPAVRARLDARAAVEGWPALHAELARVDPVTARRLKTTDAQRIQRALEVHELAGKPLSELQGARESVGRGGPDDPGRARAARSRRAASAIAARFDAMLAAGLVAELEALRARYPLDAGHAVDALRGLSAGVGVSRRRIDAATLRATGIAATRQLAKRQFTWLRSLPATAFDPSAPDVADRVAAFLSRGGTARRPDSGIAAVQ